MLKLKIVMSDNYDDDLNEFVTETVTLELEHSLVSLSKWESEWEKPFLTKEDKTSEETLSYIKCMVLTPEFPPEAFDHMTQAQAEEIREYIQAKMTATWFSEEGPSGPPSTEKITSELIYYWMVSYQIPWEAEKWHLARLFTLIKVFNAKNAKKDSRSGAKTAEQRRALNEQRKAQMGTSG